MSTRLLPSSLPLSCAGDFACSDSSGFDAGIVLAVVGALAVLVVASLLFRHRHTQWTFLLGLLALVTGAAIGLAQQPPASFGWFAYIPTSDSVFVPMMPSTLPGLILVGTGLLVTGVGIGGMLRRGAPFED
ncbi:hypothetical protein FVA74_10220 [Salinibacterium sp. dk2585]|uniref:hypothetical protein n=1 Tax=unclassified Salinibacterium TaxID=2632331 RepID=UPI0011C246B0|nr:MULTISPECIES: hypothetical protein [unclassified Salinibacterium]QEE61900.1 hypothetical protein FVA74_10220 [Salinibacterium sp. dk2585]TXK54545.1 hypothetical protein FVP63_05740 [Salinibacterium sp. dk5596]